jgi:hypothetical protein
LTAFWEILDAAAAKFGRAAMIVAAPAAPTAPCNSERRDSGGDQLLGSSGMDLLEEEVSATAEFESPPHSVDKIPAAIQRSLGGTPPLIARR